MATMLLLLSFDFRHRFIIHKFKNGHYKYSHCQKDQGGGNFRRLVIKRFYVLYFFKYYLESYIVIDSYFCRVSSKEKLTPVKHSQMYKVIVKCRHREFNRCVDLRGRLELRSNCSPSGLPLLSSFLRGTSIFTRVSSIFRHLRDSRLIFSVSGIWRPLNLKSLYEIVLKIY